MAGSTIKADRPMLGFVGQGWIGRNQADHFQERGFSVVRYALEPEYRCNKHHIADCDMVFIAVPTPTTPQGFDASALRSALALVGAGKTAVIRSTMLPGTTDDLAEEFLDRFVFYVPEFLREVTARFDIDNPDRNIVGIPAKHRESPSWIAKAETVMHLLPTSTHRATYKLICTAAEAELIKHGTNGFLYLKTVFMNILYDVLETVGGDWNTVAQALMADPRIGASHMYPVHQNGHMGAHPGRGAGGHCLPKDFLAFRQAYEEIIRPDDLEGIAMLKAVETKNVRMLLDSGKDRPIVDSIYGGMPISLSDVVGRQTRKG